MDSILSNTPAFASYSVADFAGAWAIADGWLDPDGTINDQRNGLGDPRTLQPKRARSFNGTNQYATGDWNHQNLIKLSGACWIKSTISVYTQNYTFFGTDRLTGAFRGWALRTEISGGGPLSILACMDGGATNYLRRVDASGTNIHDGQWHHIGFSIDHSASPRVVLYIDGVAVPINSTGVGSPNKVDSPSNLLYLAYRDSSPYTPCTIFDIQFEANIAWTPQQFADAFSKKNPILHSGTTSARHFKLDGQSTLLEYDSSGNENHLTLVNAPTSYSGRDVPHSYQNSVGYTLQRNFMRASHRWLVATNFWTASSSATLTPNDAIAPDGTMTAAKIDLLDGASDNSKQVYHSTSQLTGSNNRLEASTDYCASVWIKQGTNIQSVFEIDDNGFSGQRYRIIYTWATGVVTTTGTGLARISFAGVIDTADGGWVRIGMIFETNTTAGSAVWLNRYYSGYDYRWGPQIEEGTEFTEYQRTSYDGTSYAGLLLARDESNPTKDIAGNDLQYVGECPWNGQAEESNSLTLNGTSQVVEYTPIELTGNFELEYYFKYGGGNSKTIFCHDTNTAVVLRIQDATTLRFNVGGTFVDLTVPDMSVAIRKYKLTRVGSVASIYVDDVLEDTQSGAATGTYRLAMFGARAGASPGLYTEYVSCQIFGIKATNGDGSVLFETPCSEGGAQTHVTDKVSGNQFAIVNFATGCWANTQDVFHENILNGFSLYEHTSLAPIRIPFDINGDPIDSPTVPSGYTLTRNVQPTIGNNGSETKLDFTPVVAATPAPYALPGDGSVDPAAFGGDYGDLDVGVQTATRDGEFTLRNP